MHIEADAPSARPTPAAPLRCRPIGRSRRDRQVADADAQPAAPRRAFEPPSSSAKPRPGRDQPHSASEPPGPNAIIKLKPTPLLPRRQLSLVAHRPHSRPRAIDPLEHPGRPLIQPQQVPSTTSSSAFSVRHSSTHPRRPFTPPRYEILIARPARRVLLSEIIFLFYFFFVFMRSGIRTK
jgi:hypothetical protein